MKKYRTPFLLLLVFAGVTCHSQSGKAYHNLSAKKFEQTLGEKTDKISLDVRTPEEYAEGHIQGAINVDWNGDTFDQQVLALDKSKPIMVYCAGGGRSSSASKDLARKGFTEIYNLESGLDDWKDKGLPVTKD